MHLCLTPDTRYRDRWVVEHTLDTLHAWTGLDTLIVPGARRGVAQYAHQWAIARGVPCVETGDAELRVRFTPSTASDPRSLYVTRHPKRRTALVWSSHAA